MGSLFTTSTGAELSTLVAGDYFLDFLTGNITQPDGTVTQMNKNLNDLGLSQCNSIGVWTSDSDSTVYIGSAITMSDHQLAHVVNNYGFSAVRINIPSNSTPDDTNQLFFMAGTDGWLGYHFPTVSHSRFNVSGTSTNTATTYVSKHCGSYNQILFTVSNTHGSNSLDLQIQYSEDGTTWFNDSGYVTAVVVAGLANSVFATEIEHHFYIVRINSTSSGNHASFVVYANLVQDRGT